MTKASNYTVRATRCDHRAADEEIYETLCDITEPLTRSWEKLESASKIVIKTNMIMPPDRIASFEGRRRELVDDSVMRATLRLLRERTNAHLVVTDTTFRHSGEQPLRDVNFMPLLDEFDVEFVNSNEPPFEIYDVPGGGLMFSRYLLSACFGDADAVVSVAKMKSHAFMGITLCLKNLFGLPVMPPHGKTRSYFHHIIRLSYVLPDLGLITQPCLNIIDALTGQSGREWGGEGRVCDALIAGNHVIATDACGAYLMGHDPKSDWPTPPFKRDRNAILIAAENGFGTVNLEEIDFQSDIESPLSEFDSAEVDSTETVRSWRITTCEQGLFYREHQKEMIDKYAGDYIYLQDGEVVWNGPDPTNLGSRRDLSRGKKDSALWLKLVDSEDVEREHFEVYEQNLEMIQKHKA